MMRHFAEYSMPGSFLNEEEGRELDARDVAEAIAKAPASAFAFVLYDPPAEVPDVGPDFRVIPKRQNVSAKHYIDGTVRTLAEIEARGSEVGMLAANMRGNGWDRVVECRTGNFQPFEDGDQIVGSDR